MTVAQMASRVSSHQLTAALREVPGLTVLDVRRAAERAQGYIGGSIHMPLVQLRRRMSELDPARPLVAYCAAGYRSSIAASLLRSQRFTDVSDLIGGYQAWAALPMSRSGWPGPAGRRR